MYKQFTNPILLQDVFIFFSSRRLYAICVWVLFACVYNFLQEKKKTINEYEEYP